MPAHAVFARTPFKSTLTGTLLAVGLCLAPPAAHAQLASDAAGTTAQSPSGLWLTTPYPAFSAPIGEDVTIDLSLANRGLPPQRVALSVEGLPEGWQWQIKGSGKPVAAAIAALDETVDLSLQLTPPENAVGQTVNFTVAARSEDGAMELPLTLTLTETMPAQLTLEPELPALRGTARSTFDFQVEVANDGQEDTVVNLLAEAPPGFQVSFKERYGSQELTSLPLSAGGTKNLEVSVDPPENAEAGQYPVMVQATGGDASARTQLVLDITGRPDLSLSGPGGRLSGEATAGEARSFEFTLENRGTAPARSISFSSSPPSGWEVTFSPERIEEIAPGESSSVNVSITPSDQAIAGDYVVSVRANGDGASDSESFRVTVRTSTVWGVVGLGIIAAAVAVLGVAVTRYGRR